MSLSATTMTTDEAQDVAGVGRKLTASESYSMRTMRAHKLRGEFVEDCRRLKEHNACTSDYIQA